MTVPTSTQTKPTHATNTDAGNAARRPGLGSQLLRRKPIGQMVSEAGSSESGTPLVRSFGVLQLTMISVGATLGTGILVILGESVPLAGPAVWISFVVAGLAALFSAVSYAEMAGLVPVAGSSYSYSYATMGEGMAWICGWCLVLEYAVSVAAVAVGAGQYVNETLAAFGQFLPDAMSQPPGSGGVVNVPAMLIVVLAMVLLVRGAKESAWINTAIVTIKIVILLFFCAVAFTAFNAGNFEPLMPMGAAGVSAAASRVFFSYIGFDAASTAGEEARNPKRDLPRAILLSMVIVTSIYVLVAVAAIGARPWEWFGGTEAALVQILEETTHQPWIALVFSIGAVLAIASIVLTVLYGQTRILLSMSRDGLVPRSSAGSPPAPAPRWPERSSWAPPSHSPQGLSRSARWPTPPASAPSSRSRWSTSPSSTCGATARSSSAASAYRSTRSPPSSAPSCAPTSWPTWAPTPGWCSVAGCSWGSPSTSAMDAGTPR